MTFQDRLRNSGETIARRALVRRCTVALLDLITDGVVDAALSAAPSAATWYRGSVPRADAELTDLLAWEGMAKHPPAQRAHAAAQWLLGRDDSHYVVAVDPWARVEAVTDGARLQIHMTIGRDGRLHDFEHGILASDVAEVQQRLTVRVLDHLSGILLEHR